MGIRSRVFLIVFLSLGVGISISYIVAERDLSSTFKEQLLLELEKQASLLVEVINKVDLLNNIDESDALADRLGSASKSRVTLILNNGEVVGDSDVVTKEIYLLDNHINREEIQKALLNGTGWSFRYSNTLKKDLLYFATIDKNKENPNVIRIAVPYTYLDKAIASLDLSIILVAVVTIIVAFIASTVAANYTYSSISELASATSRIAAGKTKKRDMKALPTERHDEFGSVARNISEISEDLKSKINLIAKQRDQFGSVLDDLGHGIIVTNVDGDITYENEKFTEILNLDDITGKNISDLNIKSMNYLYRRAKKKKNADIEFEVELGDRSTRWVLGSMNQSKTTKEFIMVIHDISQLRKLNQMRRDFVSNVSHELRTPVSVIRANSETLVDGALQDQKQAKVFAKAILHNAERLSDMVKGLLDLSRIEYGELKLNIKSLDLFQEIYKTIESLKHLGKKRNIKVEVIYSKKANVMADINALERILTNLIENAYKYSDDDSTIKVSTIKLKDHIEINISDQGKGISEDEKGFIFDRFFRTAEARATEETGSGLGLAIVKNLVNSLNGEVGIKNSNSQGSIFWFTLPKAKSMDN